MSEPRSDWRALVIAVGGTLLYLLTAPAVPNADGLGYLKLLPHNFAAGHLLWMPLLRGVTRIVGDGLHAGRLIDALLGGTGLLLIYGLTRRVLGGLPLGRPFDANDVGFAATFAAVGLGLSWGYWSECNDVEAYAAATVAWLCLLRVLAGHRARPTMSRAALAGVLLGVAVLTHLTHVLAVAVVVVALASQTDGPRRAVAQIAVALSLGGAIALGGYVFAAVAVRGHDFAGAMHWVATAGHGFSDGAGAWRAGDAVFGLTKSLIWAPYLYEGNQAQLLSLFLAGLAPLVALTLLAWRDRGLLASLRAPAIAAIAPYAAVAVAFFGADSERWIFTLPILWLLAGAVVARLRHRRVVAAAVAVYLFAFNYTVAVGPARADAAHVRAHATAAAAALEPGDLVVFPGHSWDEYLSLYAHGVEPFPLAYYAARDGTPAMWQRLEHDAVTPAGRRVVGVRLCATGDDGDPRGFDELRLLGLPAVELTTDLRRRFSVEPMVSSSLCQLRPAW